MAKPKYIVTYTQNVSENLDDDFTVLEIRAHSQKDAELIMSNIERLFDGITITIEQEEEKKRVRRKRK